MRWKCINIHSLVDALDIQGWSQKMDNIRYLRTSNLVLQIFLHVLLQTGPIEKARLPAFVRARNAADKQEFDIASGLLHQFGRFHQIEHALHNMQIANEANL